MQRFTFDHDFDERAEARRRALAEAEKRAEEELYAELAPTFSEEEMEEAKQAAHHEGRQEGMADALAGLEQQVASTLDAIMSRLPTLFEEEKRWAEEIQSDAIKLATTIVKKLAPSLMENTHPQEIEQVVQSSFNFLTEQPKVMIRVPTEVEEFLKDKIHLMASRVGYEGQVVLVGDPELTDSDCRISWLAGAVERSLDETWDHIDETIAQTLKGMPERVRTNEYDDGSQYLPDTQEEADTSAAAEDAAETADSEAEADETGVETSDAQSETAEAETTEAETAEAAPETNETIETNPEDDTDLSPDADPNSQNLKQSGDSDG